MKTINNYPKVGDILVAFNPLMSFSSSSLTIDKEYIVLEFVPGDIGRMQMVVVIADNGRKGIFDLARFKSKKFYDQHIKGN